PITRSVSCGTARSATLTRKRPNGWRAWPRRLSTSAGTPTRRWPPAAPIGSLPTRGRNADGPFDQLPGPGAAQPARRLRVTDLEYPRRRKAAGRRRRWRDRALLPVRGAAAAGSRAERTARRRRHRQLRRGAVLLPGRHRG